MTDHDVDDSAFLTSTNHRITSSIHHPICQSSPLIHNPRNSGGGVGNENNASAAKKSLYENHGVAACSHNKALCIATIVFALLFSIAIIVAFTGPQNDCLCTGEKQLNYVGETNSTKISIPRATNGQIFPWIDIHLPTFIKPYRYNITIHPNLTTLEVKSQVSIEFHAQNDTNFIVLHSDNLTILDKMIQDSRGNNLTITRLLEYPEAQQIYIEIREKFEKRHNYTMKIRYNFELNKLGTGFYLTSYINENGDKKNLAATQFETTYARTAFPCFDEPQFKARFRLTIFRDRFHITLFNTPVINTNDLGFYMGTGLLRDDFLETKEMSTYLVAFVVCDYTQQSIETENGLSVSVYTSPDRQSRAAYVLNTTAHILNYYENLFGVSYPLSKLDMVALPEVDQIDAVENWGLITYHETAISYKLNETSVSTIQLTTSAIAHSLAHQWFGNLVTIRWWNESWLSESFATLFQYQGVDDCFRDWKMMDQFLVDKFQPAFTLDALGSSYSISTAIDDPDDTFILDKGAAILHMLSKFLQEDALHNGLNEYLTTYQYSVAEARDLWAVFSRSANHTLDVEAIIDTWIQQEGFPLITLKREDNEIVITQKRFLVTADQLKVSLYSYEQVGHDYKWYIPFTYVTDYDTEPNCLWLNKTDERLGINSDTKWIKANVNQTGFYRVMYDEDMWLTLISLLKSNHQLFSPADRAGLIDDAFSLCRASLLNASIVLDLTMYLVKERDYAPWATAVEHLKSWARRLSESLAYKLFLKYMRQLLTPIVKYVGWNRNKSHMNSLLSAKVLSAALLCEHEDTVSNAKAQFQNWMLFNKSIDPNLKEIVYSVGVKYGGLNEWQYCWNYYKNASEDEKQILLKAMGDASDPWLLQRYLMETLETNVVKPEDVKLVLEVVAANPEGRLLAWRHLKAYWSTMHSLYGNSTIVMGHLISAVTAYLSTQYDLYEVSTYFSGMHVGSASKYLNRSLEIIHLNINWIKQNEETINHWLRKNII